MSSRALLVVDVQKVYTSPGSELYCARAGDTIRRINDLVVDATRRKDTIIVVRHVHRADGSDLGRMFDYQGEPTAEFNFKEGTEEVEMDDALTVPSSAIHLCKTRYSAFVGTSLLETLQGRQISALTICGFMTNFCCEATARQGHDLDYYVDFITDATGTPGTESQTQAQIRARVADTLEAGYARVWSTKRWCGRPQDIAHR